ncbi:uncharacterized protein J8A68_003145 [[Candida] subhashii]|uniref:Uncharacterized protein n=1 Tax=[Candida] subhashii TaxID=561895 RepID=A0A8J5QJJ8_9ASCO|nr:uncharacterized protein J8A68_003145 [[Candida] subhashii]KAG7663313.1 hypothetical protein J8A68_003145 [[Candida] subhashii]
MMNISKLNSSPEIIQSIFDFIPQQYLKEYLQIKEIRPFAFNSYYANIRILDNSFQHYTRCSSGTEVVIGENNLYRKSYKDRNIGNQTYLFDQTESPQDWDGYFTFGRVREFIGFCKDYPDFRPVNLCFDTIRDVPLVLDLYPGWLAQVRNLRIVVNHSVSSYNENLRILQFLSTLDNVKLVLVCDPVNTGDIPSVIHWKDKINRVIFRDCKIAPPVDCLSSCSSCTKLTLDSTSISAEDVPLLPSNLTSLSLLNSLIIPPDPEIKLRLPTRLKHLVITYTHHEPQIFQLDIRSARCLTSFKATIQGITNLRYLKLPKSIKNLDLSCRDIQRFEHIEDYPDLESFKLRCRFRCIEYDTWTILRPPPKLKELKIWDFQDNKCSWDTDIDLTFLRVISSTSFPTSCELISIGAEYYRKAGLGGTISKHKHLGFQKHDQIRDLKIYNLNLQSIKKFHFPSSLFSLCLEKCEINNLKIRNLKALSNLRILNLNKNRLCELDDEWISELPPGLQVLNLSHNLFTRLSEIPCPGLLELNLEYNKFQGMIAGECIKVPDSCEILNLNGNPIESFGESLEFPSTLKELSLRRTKLSNVSDSNFFRKLPDDLEVLDICPLGSGGGPIFSVSDEYHIPKGLKKLVIGNVSLDSQGPVLLKSLKSVEILDIQSFNELDLSSLPQTSKFVRCKADTTIGELNHLHNFETLIIDTKSLELESRQLIIPQAVQKCSIACQQETDTKVILDDCADLVYLELSHELISLDYLLNYFQSIYAVNPKNQVFLGVVLYGVVSGDDRFSNLIGSFLIDGKSMNIRKI